MRRSKSLRPVRIAGTGMYVPPDVYTNDDLAKMMDTSDEWIQQRSGIKQRHYAKPGLGSSDLALEASRTAISAAGCEPKDIDMVIFATLSPDYYFPGSAVFLADKLGLGTTPALDVRNQCSGFLYGLSLAHLYIGSGQCDRVLLVGAEVHSRALNMTTPGRDVSVLFGDGSGAVVLEASPDAQSDILSVHLHAEGAHRDMLKVEFPSMRQWPYITKENLEAGQHWPKMDGRQVFKHAVTRMPEVIQEALAANELKAENVDLFLLHQANLRINEAALKSLGQPLSKSFNNIERYGNCSAASIPMCLDEAVRAGRVERGSLICMAAFGAGFTWGSALLRW